MTNTKLFDSAKKKILIVDDEKQLVDFWKLKLTHEGFDVEESYNGQEAMDKMKKTKFDLIILDLKMPVKDGFEVLEEMKETKNDISSVYVLTSLDEQALDRAMKMGAKEGFLKYKISPKELMKKIKNQLV